MKTFTNTRISKIHRIAIIVLISVSYWTTSYAQTTNFSGTWVIDKQKINFNNAPEWILPIKFVINQEQSDMEIQTTMANKDLVQTAVNQKLAFSGQITESSTASGGKLLTSIKWSNDQRSFVLSAQSYLLGEQSALKLTEAFSLTDDGKTLVADRSVEQPDGSKYKIKAFYDKQQ